MEPEPIDEAGVRKLRGAIGERAPDESARARAVLVAGGLSPDAAAGIVGSGITAETATDLLSVELLHPEPSRYGPAIAVLSLLAEACELGALSGRSVGARLSRLERALGNPRDPDVPLEELLDHLELAPQLGQDAVRELKAMILERIGREVRGLDGLPAELRRAKVRALRDFADRAEIEIRDALRNPARPPPRSTLSREAQNALREIDRGADGVRVSARAVAEEILGQYPDYIETAGWTMGQIKQLIDGKHRTFHWDDVFGEDGRLMHHEQGNPHAKTPHLQLHRPKDRTLRIFFPTEVR